MAGRNCESDDSMYIMRSVDGGNAYMLMKGPVASRSSPILHNQHPPHRGQTSNMEATSGKDLKAVLGT